MSDPNPIRLARQAAGKSQEDVARAIGVSLGTVAKWERGAEPTGGNLLRLAGYFGRDPRELLVVPDSPEAA